jgi:hypothetical protein
LKLKRTGPGRKPSSLWPALALLLPVLCLAGPPAAFEATYGLYRNGKLAGEVRFSFVKEGDNWTLATESEGTRGIARFLGLQEHSSSNGRWRDNGPVPLAFTQRIKVSLKTILTSAEFDWDAMQVTSRFDGEEIQLPIEPGTLDAVSEGLAIRAGLAAGEQAWSLSVLDEDEIEIHDYRAGEPTRLDTALGCQDVSVVERVRAPTSTRYTRTAFAAGLGWVPIRVEHGKTDGEQMDTRIETLTLDGVVIKPGPACPEAGAGEAGPQG